MGEQEVLAKETRGKVVKLNVLSAESIRSGEAADTGKFMHILLCLSLTSRNREDNSAIEITYHERP